MDYPLTVMTETVLEALRDGDTGTDILNRKWLFKDGYVTREDGCEWDWDSGMWAMIGPNPEVVRIAAELAGVTYEEKYGDVWESYTVAVNS